MTLEEWCKVVDEKLTASGFEVSRYEGFPLIEVAPDSREAFVALMKLTFKVPSHVRTYYDGKVLFTSC